MTVTAPAASVSSHESRVSQRSSLAKAKSDHARMLSTKVKSLRNVMTGAYQLGSNHTSSHVEQVDDIDDIDESAIDFETDAEDEDQDEEILSSDEFATEKQDPLETRSHQNHKPSSPRSPACVMNFRETASNEEEIEYGNSNGRSGSKPSKHSRGRERGDSSAECIKKKGGDEAGSLGTRKASELSKEELGYEETEKSPQSRLKRQTKSSQSTKEDQEVAERSGHVRRRQNRRSSTGTGLMPTSEDLGYEDTAKSGHLRRSRQSRRSSTGPELTTNTQPESEDLGYADTEKCGHLRRQNRRCSTGTGLMTNIQPTTKDLGYADAERSSQARRQRQNRRCSTGTGPIPNTQPAVEDLGYEDTEKSGHSRRSKQNLVTGTGLMPGTQPVSGDFGYEDTEKRSGHSRRSRQGRRSSTGPGLTTKVPSATESLASIDKESTTQARRRRQSRRSSTGTGLVAAVQPELENLGYTDTESSEHVRTRRRSRRKSTGTGATFQSAPADLGYSGGNQSNEAGKPGEDDSAGPKKKGSRGSSRSRRTDKPRANSDEIGKNSLSNRNERLDAAHKRRSRFVNQKTCKVAPINRRSRSRRNLTDGKASADGFTIDGHGSGSISSLTVSTGFLSKDDMSLSSPFQKFKPACSLISPSGHAAALSRWQSNPHYSQNTSSDDIRTHPGQDLSSVRSGDLLPTSKGKAAGSTSSKLNAGTRVLVAPVRQLSTRSGMTPMTPSSFSKNSSSLQSLSLEDKRFHTGGSKSSLYPEILIPSTPCRSTGGISALSTPTGTGIMSNGSSPQTSLHGKLQKLASRPNFTIGLTEPSTPGGLISELSTPYTERPKMQGDQFAVPATPVFSINENELATPSSQELTPGGFVSELTFGDSYSNGSSMLSMSPKNKLGTWMTNVQSAMIHEGEYNHDHTPKMVRRHSLDSVSFIEEPTNLATNDQGPSSDAKESDFAPRAPSRQMSVASHLC